MKMLRMAGLSDCGRTRDNNQDHYLIGQVVAREALWSAELDVAALGPTGLICAVADGLGGHRGGAVASRLVLEMLAASSSGEQDVDGVWLGRLLVRAHEKLVAVGAERPELCGLSTTIVGAHLRADGCTVFHAGDSRLYRYRDGFLNQLTDDHSPTAVDVRLDKTFQRRASSAIFNCLGGSAGDTCQPSIRADIQMEPRDTFLLCSDGLTDAIPDTSRLESVLAAHTHPAKRARALVDAANEAGGPDNITVVVVEVA